MVVHYRSYWCRMLYTYAQQYANNNDNNNSNGASRSSRWYARWRWVEDNAVAPALWTLYSRYWYTRSMMIIITIRTRPTWFSSAVIINGRTPLRCVLLSRASYGTARGPLLRGWEVNGRRRWIQIGENRKPRRENVIFRTTDDKRRLN